MRVTSWDGVSERLILTCMGRFSVDARGVCDTGLQESQCTNTYFGRIGPHGCPT